MDIGIGLPSTIPDVDGRTVIEWARESERHGFSALATIDRLVYPNYEPLVTLAAAAAVTERIRLTTAILLAPLRGGAAVLAKQAASIDTLSRGRLVLGLAVGARPDDYEAAGIDFTRRGRLFDAQLGELRRIWAGTAAGPAGAVGPRPVRAGGPELLIGGRAKAAIRRTVEHGSGWISGGGGVEAFKPTADRVRAAWSAAGRPGAPRLAALTYFALGPDARRHAAAYLGAYYGFGEVGAERLARLATVDADAVRATVAAYAEAGCDELLLFPCAPTLDQVGLLAAAVR